MKTPFSRDWIKENKRALLAEFDDFNLYNPHVVWHRLKSCSASYTPDALISYRTFVAIHKHLLMENGGLIDAVIAKGTYSATTVKHIYTFAREIGADCIIFLDSSKGPYSVTI